MRQITCLWRIKFFEKKGIRVKCRLTYVWWDAYGVEDIDERNRINEASREYSLRGMSLMSRNHVHLPPGTICHHLK